MDTQVYTGVSPSLSYSEAIKKGDKLTKIIFKN